MEIYLVRINRVDDLGDLVRVYYFDKPAGFDWDEGAHVHLGLPGFDAGEKRDKTLVRHMSILTLVEEDTVGVITRLDSSDSRYKLMITDMKPGDEASLFKTGSALRLLQDLSPPGQFRRLQKLSQGEKKALSLFRLQQEPVYALAPHVQRCYRKGAGMLRQLLLLLKNHHQRNHRHQRILLRLLPMNHYPLNFFLI